MTSFNEMIDFLEADKNKIRKFFRNHPSKGIAGRNMWYWLSAPWKFFTELPMIWIRSLHSRVQRMKRGYGYQDVWSLDHYLSSWLPDALREIKDHPGVPSSIVENAESIEAANETWQGLLDDMIAGFEANIALGEYAWADDDERKRLENIEQVGLHTFADCFSNLWT